MPHKKNLEVITKTDSPEFFEILEKILCGVRIPKMIVKESKICPNAKASFLSYSIMLNREFWNQLNIQEKVAIIMHEIGHLKSPVQRFHIHTILIVSLLVIPAFFFTIFLPHVIFTISLIIYTRFFFTGILCLVNRWDENFADNFASQKIDKKYLISALKKSPKGKPLYKLVYYFSVWPFKTHPSFEKRINRLLSEESDSL